MGTTTSAKAGLFPPSRRVLHILLALADGERHGFGIIEEVERSTAGAVRLLPGSLYTTIKRLLTRGLIARCSGASSGTTGDGRQFYRITKLGRGVAEAQRQRMATLVGHSDADAFKPVTGAADTRAREA
jgi:DNA-binding PadR family transcriptional regulator